MVVENGVEGSVNINQQGGNEGGSENTFEFDKVVPEAYREKSYLKGVDSFDKVFSMLDGAQKKLGERPAGIPDFNTASEEETAAFWKSFGKPDDAEGYEFDLTKIPENMRAKDAESLKPIRELFHKANLNKSQAAIMQEGLAAYVMDMVQQQGAAAEAQETDFNAIAEKTFGKDHEKVMGSVLKVMEKYVPQELRAALSTTTNEQLVALSAAFHSIRKAYGVEDKDLNLDGTGGSGGGADIDSIRKEGRKLMMTEAYRDPWHPDHKETVEKVNATFAKVNQLAKK